MVTRGEGWGEADRDSGIDMYILLYLKWITNKDLLYSTGNYTPYFVLTYKGKESEYICIYTHTHICITESLCCTPEINTTLSINFTSINKN